MLKSTALPAQEKGTIFLTLLFGLPVLLTMVGLAVDFGHYYQVKRQAQTAADAGAWGGALQRGRSITGDVTPDFTLTKQAAVKDVELNGFVAGAKTGVVVNVPPTPANCPPSLTGTACSDAFVEVIVTQEVPTFFLWVVRPEPLGVTASAIAGATSAPDSFCLMTLSGDLDLKGKKGKKNKEEWDWQGCDVYVKDEIDTKDKGSLTADSITCGGKDCDSEKWKWTFDPAVKYDPTPQIDPWADRMSIINPTLSSCKYVYTKDRPFDLDKKPLHAGFDPTAKKDTIKLLPGIHCVDSDDAWHPDKKHRIDGTAGVALYVNNPGDTISLPDDTQLVAMTTAQIQETNSDPEFTGLALYGTGNFELKEGNSHVSVYGAFYFPKGSFSVEGSAEINHYNPSTPCLQVVARSIDIEDDIFGTPGNTNNQTTCINMNKQHEPTPSTPAIRAIVK